MRKSRGAVAIEDILKPPVWPADKVERRAVASLVPYARNARTHSEEQVAQIAASIREWGWTVPVLVDDQGSLIAGHGRVLAARKLGITDVPVMVARGWSAAQIASYRLTDNKLALNAGWDDEMLRLELGELGLEGFDLSLIGFSDFELKDDSGRSHRRPDRSRRGAGAAGRAGHEAGRRVAAGAASAGVRGLHGCGGRGGRPGRREAAFDGH